MGACWKAKWKLQRIAEGRAFKGEKCVLITNSVCYQVTNKREQLGMHDW